MLETQYFPVEAEVKTKLGARAACPVSARRDTVHFWQDPDLFAIADFWADQWNGARVGFPTTHLNSVLKILTQPPLRPATLSFVLVNMACLRCYARCAAYSS